MIPQPPRTTARHRLGTLPYSDDPLAAIEASESARTKIAAMIVDRRARVARAVGEMAKIEQREPVNRRSWQ